MKYINGTMIQEFIEREGLVAKGEFGYNSNYDFYYYQRSMVPPSCDGFAYKFLDFDVISYWLPYYGNLREIDEIDKATYIIFAMKHLSPELKEEFKKDLKTYWENKKEDCKDEISKIQSLCDLATLDDENE